MECKRHYFKVTCAQTNFNTSHPWQPFAILVMTAPPPSHPRIICCAPVAWEQSNHWVLSLLSFRLIKTELFSLQKVLSSPITSNWRSPADNPGLSPHNVAGLHVRSSKHRSSPEMFLVWKICSWTDLFVMRGVRDLRFHCISNLMVVRFLSFFYWFSWNFKFFWPATFFRILGVSRYPEAEVRVLLE